MQAETRGANRACWRDDDGAGPAPTVSRSGTLRTALLLSAAAGALLFGYGRSVRAGPAACTFPIVGTALCQGDQSDGIASGIDFTVPPVTTLNVNNLTGDIAPAAGVDGIEFFSAGTVTITSDTGAFGISTTGNGGDGIHALSGTGAVTVTQTGDISTTGTNSDGIFAYSNGGAVTVMQTGDISTTGGPSEGIFALSSGGGAVTVTQTGDISTAGADSEGIYAFSVGAGGGAVTVTQTGDISTTGIDGARGIIASSTGSGTVTVTQTGDISTTGTNSDGIFVVSFGDDVTVTQTGNISTAGATSDGIYARSKANGAVTVTQTGDISTTGNDSEGIFARAIGGAIGITLNGGTITSNISEGVEFSDGATNTLTVNNTVTISGGTNDILGGTGDETIDNFGTLTTPGDIDLGTGANAFNNMAGAVFNAGDSVDLGPAAGNTFTNYGDLSPGGVGSVQTTVLTGDLVQTGTGTFTVDIDGATSDFVDIMSDADLDGTVAPNLVSLGATTDFKILDSTGTTTDNGLTVTDTLTVDYELVFAPAEEVHLVIDDVDFSVGGLNRNQTNIGDNLNTAFVAGGGGLGPVLAALGNLPTLPEYADALDQLSPEIYGDTRVAALYANMDFSDTLLSCGVNQPGTLSVNHEGRCLWVAAKVRHLDSDRTAETIGYDETSGLLAVGAQVALAPDWRLGFGVGYRGSTLETDTGAKSEGDQVQGGVAVKYNPGALLLAGVVSGGRGWYDTTRPIAFDGFAATAAGDHQLDVLAGRLHASYVFGSPDIYLKPILDVAVTRVELHDLSESGAGGAGLIVDGDDHTVFSASPAVEIGTQYWLADGQSVRPFIRGGVTWWSDDDVALAASFAGAPEGVAPFAISAGMDELQADVAAGLEIITNGNSSFSIFYSGHFGETTQAHSVGLKGSLKF